MRRRCSRCKAPVLFGLFIVHKTASCSGLRGGLSVAVEDVPE